jgi:hypothetical protein
MTITLAELLKDSAYKLTQLKPAQIQALKANITMKETEKNSVPYPKDIDCFYVPLVDEPIQTEIAGLVQQSFTPKAESERLLEVAKRAVEIAIEQDEQAALDFIARESRNVFDKAVKYA